MKTENLKENLRIRKKRNDVILIISLILLACVSFFGIKATQKTGNSVQVILNNQEIYDLPIQENAFKIIQNGNQFNKIKIENGQVWVDSANCHNQVCVHHAKIQYAGQSIVCLPHRLIVQISGERDESNPIDAFSY